MDRSKWLKIAIDTAKSIDGEEIFPCGRFKDVKPRVVDGTTLYGSPELIGNKSWDECFEVVGKKHCLWYNTNKGNLQNTTKVLILENFVLPKEVKELS